VIPDLGGTFVPELPRSLPKIPGLDSSCLLKKCKLRMKLVSDFFLLEKGVASIKASLRKNTKY
jgi:hypothetical protein